MDTSSYSQFSPSLAEDREPGLSRGSATPEDSDEDLYRGAEDIEEERKDRDKTVVSRLWEGVSVSASVDLLSYSDREWRGNTTKSVLIKKGYRLVAQRFGRLCKVRGDNYCALRATLFQILSQSQRLPPRLRDMEIQSSLHADRHLIRQWKFPFGNRKPSTTQGTVAQLHVYLDLLRDRWTAAVQSSPAEREVLVQQVFQGQEEEFGLLEAVKYLMLRTASEIHGLLEMETQEVPDFSWLLFARDSSSSPQALFRNHLSHVGFSGGLEQVEMCLLGFSVEHRLQVYRLYKADSQEFITYYPSEQKADWPCLPLITEDDRHYNVPVE
ncbi:ubiquitin thioesterase otulin isoform X1 [Centroberyx affinis]|uniref:ubiquitin thioesterase otulin isoform X1 n=1 Tax=Centroberyx affinis TaxID=166261 RepID=UPI003A5C0DD2